MPGIRIRGHQKDQLGRSGTAISLEFHHGHRADYDARIIVSPRSGDLLEEDSPAPRSSYGLPARPAGEHEDGPVAPDLLRCRVVPIRKMPTLERA